MIQLTTLGELTCYSIIIAMAIVIYKGLSQNVIYFIKSMIPFYANKRIKSIEERLNDIELLYNYEFRNEILDIKKRLNKK